MRSSAGPSSILTNVLIRQKRLGHRQIQRKSLLKTQGEESHLQAKERGLREKQCRLDNQLPSSELGRTKFLSFRHPVCGALLWLPRQMNTDRGDKRRDANANACRGGQEAEGSWSLPHHRECSHFGKKFNMFLKAPWEPPPDLAAPLLALCPRAQSKNILSQTGTGAETATSVDLGRSTAWTTSPQQQAGRWPHPSSDNVGGAVEAPTAGLSPGGPMDPGPQQSLTRSAKPPSPWQPLCRAWGLRAARKDKLCPGKADNPGPSDAEKAGGGPLGGDGPNPAVCQGRCPERAGGHVRAPHARAGA